MQIAGPLKNAKDLSANVSDKARGNARMDVVRLVHTGNLILQTVTTCIADQKKLVERTDSFNDAMDDSEAFLKLTAEADDISEALRANVTKVITNTRGLCQLWLGMKGLDFMSNEVNGLLKVFNDILRLCSVLAGEKETDVGTPPSAYASTVTSSTAVTTTKKVSISCVLINA